jgi:hypothetical protein
MRAAYVSAVALLATVSVLAQPPGDVVIVPPAPPVPAVKWVPLTGTAQVSSDVTLSAGARSEWALIDVGPTLRVSTDGATAVIRSESPGTFRLLVITDGKAQFRSVTIGGPPVPPLPNPLRERLKAAYDTDKDADKAERARDLAALYRQAATLAESNEVPTSGELLRRIRDAGTVLIGPDKLVNLRKQVAVELAVILSEDAPLTDQQRKDLATLFRSMAVALEGF